MRTTDQLFSVDGKILCPDCMCRQKKQAKVKRIGPRDAVACEVCGAKLRPICPLCGNLHIEPKDNIDAQAQWCADQERISIEAERIQFFDKWL